MSSALDEKWLIINSSSDDFEISQLHLGKRGRYIKIFFKDLEYIGIKDQNKTVFKVQLMLERRSFIKILTIDKIVQETVSEIDFKALIRASLIYAKEELFDEADSGCCRRFSRKSDIFSLSLQELKNIDDLWKQYHRYL